MSKNTYLDLMKNKADKLNTVRFDHENEDQTVTLSYFDGEEWKEWLNKSVERSLITSEIDLLDKCNIITLSTCMSRGIETERCVIHAVEVSNKQSVEVK